MQDELWVVCHHLYHPKHKSILSDFIWMCSFFEIVAAQDLSLLLYFFVAIGIVLTLLHICWYTLLSETTLLLQLTWTFNLGIWNYIAGVLWKTTRICRDWIKQKSGMFGHTRKIKTASQISDLTDTLIISCVVTNACQILSLRFQIYACMYFSISVLSPWEDRL